MGSAARKISHTAEPPRSELRLVSASRGRSRARSTRIADRWFRVAAACFLVLGIAGIVRVTLAAKAAEASMDAWDLRAEVKAEELVSRTLEADRSALAAPSRIEAVACQTLNMGRPTQVSYLQLPDDAPADAEAPGERVSPAPAADGGGGLLATVMDLAADEAQVLLVGDVGLGSLR